MTKRFVLSVLILAAAFGAFAFGGGEVQSQPPAPVQEDAPATPDQAAKVGIEEARSLLDGPLAPVLLDARSREDYAASHIPGAVSIPLQELGRTALAVLPVVDAPLIVYGGSPQEGDEATKALEALGYKNVRGLGAFGSWPYETESGPWEAEAKDGTLSSFAAWDIWGHPVDESVFGKADVTMVNIWGTFCSPCVRELPELGAISRERSGGSFQIVGIVADVQPARNGVFAGRTLQDARLIAQKTNASYIHLLPSRDLVAAKLGAVAVLPETIFVDRSGKVIGDSYLGSKSKKDWERIIDKVLSEAR